MPKCYFQWLRPPSNLAIALQSTSDSSETLIGWINNRTKVSFWEQIVKKKSRKRVKTSKS